MREIVGNYGKCYIGDFFDIEFPKCQLIITDPPYNVNAKAHDQSRAKLDEKVSYNDCMTPEEYEIFSVTWFQRAMSITDMLIFSPGHTNISMWGEIQKPNDYHIHYKPDGQGWSESAMTNKGEIYLVYGKMKRRFPMNVTKQNIDHHIRYGIHPHPKPRGLYVKFLEALQPELVIDPFCGNGTLCYAAESLGIKWLACDRDERFAQCIKDSIDAGISDYIDNSEDVLLEV